MKILTTLALVLAISAPCWAWSLNGQYAFDGTNEISAPAGHSRPTTSSSVGSITFNGAKGTLSGFAATMIEVPTGATTFLVTECDNYVTGTFSLDTPSAGFGTITALFTPIPGSANCGPEGADYARFVLQSANVAKLVWQTSGATGRGTLVHQQP